MDTGQDKEELDWTMKEWIDCEKGLVNAGDDSRIRRVMQKAMAGEPVTLAFLGGSITQGSLSSTPETCYAYLVYKWWRDAFPKAVFTYVNAGIGGTTSHLGVGRVEEEVLSHHPDFVIVEFSVNDADESIHFQETYEGLVRRLLSAEGEPAVLLVHNVRYDDGGNAEAIHGAVGNYYGLPRVSMKTTIYPLLETGKIQNREITPDDLHPNDAGHELVAHVITAYLAGVKERMVSSSAPAAVPTPVQLPAPLTPNRYEQAKRYRNDALSPIVCEGFVRDETPQSCVADCFKKGFTAAKQGDRIVFQLEAACIAVQYRKTIRRPAPVAVLILDGDETSPVVLDANFNEEWGDCLYLETVAEFAEKGSHTVEIRISETHENDQEVFYLVSLIYA